MKEIDILDALYYKKINEKQAQELFDQIIDKQTKEFLDYNNVTKMTIHEWFAIAYQDMPIVTIAKWRHEGWPDTCIVCNKACDKKFSCRPFHIITIKNDIKRDCMIHHTCLSKLPQELSKQTQYNEYLDSPFWPVVAKMVTSLEKKQDIKIKTYHYGVVGYIVKQLEEMK